ncbi:MAG: 50S ribosomal protein L22 [Thermodesulfobacteriota bacterium]|nr:50S ribosomal protein L22 [Thermodesulfobacteriota bacterium]
MGLKAKVKYLRISPTKARLVADLVRGKRIDSALNILMATPKKAAGIIVKVIKSAVANASQNKSIDVDNLYIKKIFVDGGPVLKRFRPRAMGRATRIRRRTSHITVILEEM